MKIITKVVALVFYLALLVSGLHQGQNAQAALPATDVTDRLIVKLRATDLSAQTVEPGLDLLSKLSATAGLVLQRQRLLSGGGQLLRLPHHMNMSDAELIARRLRTRADVEYAVPDRLMHPQLIPNDTLYANQWHYKAFTDEVGGVNLPAAWDITTGAPGVVMAVIDTGILPNHADLVGRTLPGYDFIADPFVSNDGDARDVNPSDPGDWTTAGFCNSTSGAQNSSWHGTHVAGTLGAASNNSVGVAGVNWVSRILPVRVLGRCGGYESDVIDGMRWAAGLPVPGVPANAGRAQVLNLSLGGSGSCDSAFQSAINEINAAGSAVVVAAGNANTDAGNSSPGNCTGVITVAATTRQGNRAYYSNYGAGIEISAPGGQSPDGVLSTLNTGATVPAADDYRYYLGTSMATPHVAGIIALMLSANPDLTPAQVLANIQSTARAFPIGSSCDTALCGAGIIDAAAAVGRGSRLLKLSAAALTFAATAVGQNSPAQVLDITNTNTGSASLTLGNVSVSGLNAADFTITADSCSGAALSSRGSCALSISFSPAGAGARTASLALPGNAANSPGSIALSGAATDVARFQFSAPTYDVNEAAGTALITVTRSGDSSAAGTVDYATSDGSALAGSDYTETHGTLGFGPGDTSKTFSVSISNDTVTETGETLSLSLNNPAGGVPGIPASAVLAIADDDIIPMLVLSSVAIREGNAGTIASAIFTATLSAASNQPVSVSYVTANGTATAGVDYEARSGTINFAPGARTATLSVPITGDAAVEPNETFFVNLSNPADPSVQLAQGKGVILNDDQTLQFSSSGYVVNESAGTATISVLRVGSSDGAVSVDYSTGSGGTASAAADYTPVNGTLSFAAGDSAPKTFTVPLVNDTLPEPNESITLNLGNVSGGTTLNALNTANLIILNDDTSLTLRFHTSASGSENITNVTLDVLRAGNTSDPVTADYSIGGGTATPGLDYIAATGSVSFAGGDVTPKSLSFTVVNDDATEPSETVTITLSNPTGGATLTAPGTLTYTIVNDDISSVQFDSAAYAVNEIAGNAIITLTRSGALSGAATVNYTTANGTATPGADYTSSSGTVTFKPGGGSASFAVPIIDDTLVESKENVGLILSSPGGGMTLGTQRSAVLTITSNE